jgi:thiamine-phosphate pyrophosphorylase
VLVSVDFRLYLITDRKQLSMPLTDAVRLALEGGVQAVQVRERDMAIRELLALCRDLRAMTKEFNAKLFVNDRVDVALSVGADGVHLGHSSMPTRAVRDMVGRDVMIGVSTHSVDEALKAEADSADFVTFGPIYETPSKAGMGAPLGLDPLRSAKCKVGIPVFALGGIKGKNIGHVLWAGAYGVSMISGIFGKPDIKKAAKNITEMIAIVDRSICVQCGRR